MSTQLYTKTIGEGPDLVMLHGWAIHSGIWEDLLPQLTQHFRVTLVDLPGFGHSDLIEPYTLEHIAERILERVPKPAIWLGWSLGGLVTLTAALHDPQAISKTIIVTSSPKFILADNWPGLSFSLWKQFANDLCADYETTLLRFLTSQLLHSEHAYEMKTIVKTRLQKRPAIKSMLQGFKLIRETDLRNELAKITCPTLYIFGRSDALVPYAINEQIAKLHPNAKITVIRRAGHAPFLSHPEEFLALIKRHAQ